MDFFEKTVNTITSKGREIGDKTRDITTIAKYRNQIGTCEEVIKKNYAVIGKKYYEEHGTEADLSSTKPAGISAMPSRG